MGKQEMVAWMPSDDLKIMELHKTVGPRWSTIAGHFPGRTVSSIRNRYLRLHAGEKLRASNQITKNRCQQCGLPKRGHICQVKLNRQKLQLPAEASPALREIVGGQLVGQPTECSPPGHAELPVASATVEHHSYPPVSALPAHMQQLQRQPLGLPTPSPVLRTFAFSSQGAEPAEESEAELSPEGEASVAASMSHIAQMAQIMLMPVASHEGYGQPAVPPQVAMPLTVAVPDPAADGEREQPSTPAAA